MVNPGLIALPEDGTTRTQANEQNRALPVQVRLPVQSGTRVQQSRVAYFFLPEPNSDCRFPTPFWLGAAAMVLILSFFGFLVSRLLRCSPLAMSLSLGDAFDGIAPDDGSNLAKDSYSAIGPKPI